MPDIYGMAAQDALDQQDQQPGLLPIQRNGALPLGTSTVQGSPAATSSGSPLEQLIQAQIAKFQKTEGASFLDNLLGAKRDRREALTALPTLIQARKDEQAQQQAVAKNTLDFSKLVAEHSEKFFSLPPEVQDQTRDLMKSVFTRGAKMAGLPIDPGMIEHAFDTKDASKQMMDLFFDDPAFTDGERTYWSKQMASAKTPEARDKVLGDAHKLAEDRLTQALRQQIPGLVAKFGGTPDQPLEISQFTRAAMQAMPSLAQSPTLARAFMNYVGNKDNAAELAGYGLKPGTVSLAGQMKQAENQAAGPQLSQDVKDVLAGQPGPGGAPLLPSQASTTQITAARKTAQGQRVEVSGAQGKEAEMVKRGFELSPEERAKYISVGSLLKTGDLIQPPAGTTREQANKNPDLAAVDEKQKEALRQLKPTRAQLDIFQGLGQRVITAQSPTEAAQQGLGLYAGALTGANPVAKAYWDASEGFLGNLSRSVGGERGVLTDRDIARMRQASIASFFDTAQTREFKAAIINDIWGSAHQALVSEIAGKDSGGFKSQLQGLLNKLDDSTKASFGKGAIPADKKLGVNDAGEVRVFDKGAKLPSGFKDFR